MSKNLPARYYKKKTKKKTKKGFKKTCERYQDFSEKKKTKMEK